MTHDFEGAEDSDDMVNRIDGNALAGPLGDLFAVDVTAADVACIGCGKRQVVAALEVYAGGPGLVARCTGCHDVILRTVQTPDCVYIDLRGTTWLRIARPDG